MNACEILRAALQLHYVYECEPAEVNEYCYRRFPIWLYVREQPTGSLIPKRRATGQGPVAGGLKEFT
jgi:hypothetical protein